MFIYEDLVYTLDWRDQIEVINVSLPTAPEKVGEFHLSHCDRRFIDSRSIGMDYPFMFMGLRFSNNTYGVVSANITDYSTNFVPFNSSLDFQNPEFYDITHWYNYDEIRTGSDDNPEAIGELRGPPACTKFGQYSKVNLFNFKEYLIMSQVRGGTLPPTIKLYNISSPLQPIEIGECFDILEEAWNLIYFRDILFMVGRKLDGFTSSLSSTTSSYMWSINITDPIHPTETDDLEDIKAQNENVGNFDLSETKICLSDIGMRLKIISLLPTNTVVIVGGISIVSVAALSLIVLVKKQKSRAKLV